MKFYEKNKQKKLRCHSLILRRFTQLTEANEGVKPKNSLERAITVAQVYPEPAAPRLLLKLMPQRRAGCYGCYCISSSAKEYRFLSYLVLKFSRIPNWLVRNKRFDIDHVVRGTVKPCFTDSALRKFCLKNKRLFLKKSKTYWFIY